MNQPGLFPETLPVVEVQSTAFTALLAERRALGQTPIAVHVTGPALYRVTFSDDPEVLVMHREAMSEKG